MSPCLLPSRLNAVPCRTDQVLIYEMTDWCAGSTFRIQKKLSEEKVEKCLS